MAQRRGAERAHEQPQRRAPADAAAAGAGVGPHRVAGTNPAASPSAGSRQRSITFRLPTPHGEAEVVLDRPSPAGAAGVLVLGHGASGGVDAPDLVAVRDAAVAAKIAVARVTQPYRLQGRRAPAPAVQLDAAFVAAVGEIRRRVAGRPPLVVGGRSSGARVAARTASSLGALGVLALAFPLHPPGRPDRSRAGELDPRVPTLVVNGDADPFGVPQAVGAITVVVRPGERHDLRRNPAGVADVAVAWLTDLLNHA